MFLPRTVFAESDYGGRLCRGLAMGCDPVCLFSGLAGVFQQHLNISGPGKQSFPGPENKNI
jgi:hypothetical protein